MRGDRNAIVGRLDVPDISDRDWAAFSAGYEAGLAEGISRTRLQVVVELAPLGPAHAGLRLWRTTLHARLTERRQPGSRRTGPQLVTRARASWGLNRPAARTPGPGRPGGGWAVVTAATAAATPPGVVRGAGNEVGESA